MYIVFLLCIHGIHFQKRHDIPLSLARYLRASTSRIDLRSRARWTTLPSNTIPRVMSRHFGVAASQDDNCDVFSIEGVPAAAMIYSNSSIMPSPKAFYVNKGLLLLFDASPLMRAQLYSRYKKLSIGNARNGNLFLSV